ncbi:MAG TPA: GAF domain-containing protein [Coriobacteriia bacterium]
MVAPIPPADVRPPDRPTGPLSWWPDRDADERGADLPSRRPVSRLGLFRMVLALRWLALLALPIQEGVGTGPASNYVVWAGIAVAVLYTALLTALSKKALAFHLSGPSFAVIDMAVMGALYATGQGTSWPFFLFGTTTIVLPGLSGSVGASIVAALVWNALTVSVHLLRGVPASQALAIPAIEDIFNLSMIAAIWAYGVRVALRLDAAYADLADSRDALARTHRVLDDREKEIRSLLDLGAAMIGKGEASDMLRVVIDALAGMGFGRCRVFLLDGDRLEAAVTGDETSAGPEEADELAAIAEGVFREGAQAAGEIARGPGTDAGVLAMSVPILTPDEMLGFMVVESLSGEPYTDSERELLELLAGQIALAIQHVRFGEQGRELAVAEERSRITNEIHDTVVQKIYGASLLVGSLRSGEFSPRVADMLRLLEETVLMSLKDLRFAVLNWDSLAWRGTLPELVERYVEEFGTLTGIPSTLVRSGGDCGLGPARAKDLLRILQEALSNVWRHAFATEVRVELDLRDDRVDLTIADNGRGYDPDRVGPRPDTGLGGMEARSARNGGILSVSPAPGHGTVVRVRMPCQGGAR